MNHQYSTRMSASSNTSVAVAENSKRSKKGLRSIAQAAVAVLCVDGAISSASAASVILENDELRSLTISQIGAGETFGGLGTLAISGGHLTIASGGKVSPGSIIDPNFVGWKDNLPTPSIGYLGLLGNLTFSAGSVFEIEVEPNSAGLVGGGAPGRGYDNDTIFVGGNLVLGGDFRFVAQKDTVVADFANGSAWEIAGASGLITGAFSSTTTNLAYLVPNVEIDPSGQILWLSFDESTPSNPGGTPGTNPPPTPPSDGNQWLIDYANANETTPEQTTTTQISGAGNLLGGNGVLELTSPSQTLTITNGAKLSPGALIDRNFVGWRNGQATPSINTLTIYGNVVFGTGGIFEVEVEPGSDGNASVPSAMAAFANPNPMPGLKTNADVLLVQGNLQLGGTLLHVPQKGTAATDFANGQQWKVAATESGLITGSFDTVRSEHAFLNMDYQVTSDTVLNQSQLFVSFEEKTLDGIVSGTSLARYSANQQMVLRTIFNGNTLGSFDPALGMAYDDPIRVAVRNQVTQEGELAALDSLTGEIHASIANQATQMARTQGVNHLNRLSLHHWKNAQGKIEQTAPGSDLWVKIEGSNEQITGSDSSATTKVDSYLLQLGYDTQLENRLLVGGYLTYGQHEVDVDDRFSEAEFGQWGVSAYVGYDFAEANQDGFRWVSQASMHNLTDIETTRQIAFGRYEPIKTSYDGTIWRLDNELAYTMAIDAQFTLEPHAILGLSYLDMDGFEENANTNLFALKGDSRSESSSDLTVGLRARYTPTDTVTVFSALGWQHVLQKPDREYQTRFTSGLPMTIEGAVADRDAAVLDLGARLAVGTGTDMSLQYQGGFGSKYERHTFTLGVQHRF